MLTNTTESASSGCGQDWVAFGDKCYKLLESQAFEAAERDCERTGGTLASIHNVAQNRFLTKYVRSEQGEKARFYIGLQRHGSHGFTWSDGSAYDFQAWQPHEPNHPSTEECVEVWTAFGDRNGGWNDITCSTHRHALCQKNAEDF